MSSTASGMVTARARQQLRPNHQKMMALLEFTPKSARCYPNDREGPSPQSLASSITASIISKVLACDWL